jgi:hypothetical protein
MKSSMSAQTEETPGRSPGGLLSIFRFLSMSLKFLAFCRTDPPGQGVKSRSSPPPSGIRPADDAGPPLTANIAAPREPGCRRCERIRNWKFESIPLQRTVRVSQDIPLLRRKAGLFPRVCGAAQVARSGETGVARSYGAAGWQYLCRAKFQYRSVDEADGLMRRIGQRPSRAGYADCARQAVDVRVGSSNTEYCQLLVSGQRQTRVHQQLTQHR